jgi:hypothetical protein
MKKANKTNKTVKVYDKISHRSYSFKASDVNVTKTRQNPGALYLHDSSKTRLPGNGPLSISENIWRKFNRGHRNEW